MAQAVMDEPDNRRFLARAGREIGHLFPQLPSSRGFHKRRRRLWETIEWLVGVFAQESPGFYDDVVLLDSTPVERGRSVETTRRSQLAEASGHGFCRSHSRWFWVCACTSSAHSTARRGRRRSSAAGARPAPRRES